MRADRLVSVLLMLQRRGQVTAAEVADELEISARTARRDLEALGMAGLPVYSVAGRGGGWRLLGEGRTDLSGLSATEAVALFALVGSAGAHQPPETAAALRKLTRALPEPMRDAAERAASSIRVAEDPYGGRGPDAPPLDNALLAVVRESVVRERRVNLTYTTREGGYTTRTIDPLGLVARGPRWYLIAGTERGQRTFRLDRIEGYRLLDEAVVRPESFDLDRAWSEVAAGMDDLRWSVRVDVEIDPDALPRAQFHLGDRLLLAEAADRPVGQGRADRVRGAGAGVPGIQGARGPADLPDGAPREASPVRGVVRGWSITELATHLAGMHPWVRVTGPPELRELLADIGRSLAVEHGSESGR